MSCDLRRLCVMKDRRKGDCGSKKKRFLAALFLVIDKRPASKSLEFPTSANIAWFPFPTIQLARATLC